ncbi:hypothetical protein ROZALSC1DRAFT_29880 [Rozella allomycis CSF55]|uniref:Transcription factor IIIC, subunit 5 domain-containing protein n=1 Tax=Rozella allomycis (strain CSF55) TaxID=988480 RepID=A0A075ASC9_ROZAC|nr:Transcription factor IIIC, subunit 5 domain-containing protein [Rozella allomycis CSF55]RKP18438.1 hypothetical protein ROZALSC1DRAFT_29880 [Rozella allomycis CSF55]|eukprot:EPZ33153.1 Transcription factor IIIC, subunit 5 domain-containing protein [Rozella allomycis CSF55]
MDYFLVEFPGRVEKGSDFSQRFKTKSCLIEVEEGDFSIPGNIVEKEFGLIEFDVNDDSKSISEAKVLDICVQSACLFRGLADFYYKTPANPVKDIINICRSSTHNINDIELKVKEILQHVSHAPLLFPPLTMSQIQQPTFINFIDNVPLKPTIEVENIRSSINPELIGSLEKAFALRPIWTRKSLETYLKADYRSFRNALALCAYYSSSGPWRNCWVKFGLDPRLRPVMRYYQVVYFRKLHNQLVKDIEDASNDGVQIIDIRPDLKLGLDLSNHNDKCNFLDMNKLENADETVEDYVIPELKDVEQDKSDDVVHDIDDKVNQLLTTYFEDNVFDDDEYDLLG